MSIGTSIVAGSLVSGFLESRSSDRAARSNERASREAIEEQRRQFDLIYGDLAPYRQTGVAALSRLNSLYETPNQQPQQPQNSMSFLRNRVGPIQDSAEMNQLLAQRDEIRRGQRNMYDRGDLEAIDRQIEALREVPAESGRMYAGGSPTFNERTGEQAVSGVPAADQQGPNYSNFFASPDYQFRLDEGQKAIDRSAAARGGLLSGRAVKEGTRYASGLAGSEFGNYFNRQAALAGIGQTAVGTGASAGVTTAGNVGNAIMNAGNARGNAYMQGGQAVNNAVQGGLQNYLLYRYLN